MFATVLGASFGYADIAVLVVLGLALLIGIIRGFSKSLKGLWLTLAVILISLLLVGVTFAPVREGSLAAKLDDAMISASAGWGDAFNTPVVSTENGLRAEYNGEYVELSSIDGVKGKIANSLAGSFFTEDGQTVAQMITFRITGFVFLLGLFIAYCIGLGIVFALLRRATERMKYSQSTVVKIIDRTLGGVVSVALGLVFIFFVFAIIAALGNVAPEAADYIINSPVGGFLYGINPVGKVFADVFSFVI